MSTGLRARLKRLEAMAAERMPRSGRTLHCIVRKGREEDDHRVALQAARIEPRSDDFTILRVVVSPQPGDRMDDIRPTARLSAH